MFLLILFLSCSSSIVRILCQEGSWLDVLKTKIMCFRSIYSKSEIRWEKLLSGLHWEHIPVSCQHDCLLWLAGNGDILF